MHITTKPHHHHHYVHIERTMEIWQLQRQCVLAGNMTSSVTMAAEHVTNTVSKHTDISPRLDYIEAQSKSDVSVAGCGSVKFKG